MSPKQTSHRAQALRALVLPTLLVDPATKQLTLTRPGLLVAIPTLLLGWRTRSMGVTVIAGMLLYYLEGRIM